MKLKKLFAGVVAAAMIATMSFPAFAALNATTTDGVDVGGEVSITKTYFGTGFGEETVKLVIDNGGKPTDIIHSSMTAAEIAAAKNSMTISIASDQENGITVNDTTGEGTFKVKLPDYSRVGTYIYKIHEDKGNTAGMTYDEAQRWLVVHVINNMNGDNYGTGLTCKVGMFTSDPTNLSGDDLKAVKSGGFTNTYKNGNFTVEKKVKGNMADRDKVFNFRVTFTGIEHMNGKIKVGDDEIALTAVDNNTATYDFVLTHDQSIKFSNIPYGVTATVNELHVDENGNKTVIANAPGAKNDVYDVTYVDNQSVTIGMIKADNKVVDNTDLTAHITNTSSEHVDTGVILDNAPYILMLTVVAAGAMTLVIKKRREEE